MKTKNSIRSMEKADKFRNQIIYDPNSFQFNNFAIGAYNTAVAGAQPAPMQVSRLSPQESTLVLVITNSAAAATTVTLFNVNNNAPGATSGGLNPTFVDGVTVTVPQSSYGTILISLLTKVYKIGGLKYSCQVKNQLSNRFVSAWTSEFGTFGGGVYTPKYLGTNMQNIAAEIDDPTFELDVNATTYIQLDVNGVTKAGGTGETVELVFTVASIIDPLRTLNGQPAIAINAVGMPSGVPAQTLVVSQQQPGSGGINLSGAKPAGNLSRGF